MKRLIIFLRPWSKYLLVFWLVAIATVSSIPHLPTPKIDTGKVEIRLDYLVHFCEYGALIFLSLLSFIHKDFRLPLKRYLLITAAVLLFAMADEFHQKLIPGRTFNPKDIISNVFGIISGFVFCYIIFRKIGGGISNNQEVG